MVVYLVSKKIKLRKNHYNIIKNSSLLLKIILIQVGLPGVDFGFREIGIHGYLGRDVGGYTLG